MGQATLVGLTGAQVTESNGANTNNEDTLEELSMLVRVSDKECLAEKHTLHHNWEWVRPGRTLKTGPVETQTHLQAVKTGE